MIEFGGIPIVSDRFAHIVSVINAIQQNLRGMSEQEFAKDGKLQLALERLLEIVSVASAHIPANLKAAENGVDWQAIADIGARLENTRIRVKPEVLWLFSQDKLASLKA